MKDFAEFLGWVVVLGFGVALLNYILKYINKKYVNKLSGEMKKYIDMYRLLMRYVIRYHKLAGIIASATVIIHFIIMYSLKGLSTFGIISAVLMWIVFLLGIYGAYINKNYKGAWLKIHRTAAFILLLTIAVHVLIKI